MALLSCLKIDQKAPSLDHSLVILVTPKDQQAVHKLPDKLGILEGDDCGQLAVKKDVLSAELIPREGQDPVLRERQEQMCDAVALLLVQIPPKLRLREVRVHTRVHAKHVTHGHGTCARGLLLCNCLVHCNAKLSQKINPHNRVRQVLILGALPQDPAAVAACAVACVVISSTIVATSPLRHRQHTRPWIVP
eukprot:CAMPEP_0206213786 /NCGR_PEP_ID=MMETSP0047_2-20121206/1306_1 /ASSEMBLY_ACC=CAM_ASM_000192 /TAXON_ID=195065 /ORGANISM="Chroomonas mesostigmatica_cf, Strain CCMP1168" /LENGTH=191 /DNA_ID=CAMNT_0053635955 /DNA_START=125 /DNA_END=700 /DNA_ORIENTATION=+